jgi:hypothetical protein
MEFKVAKTNRLRDSHCGSQTQALVHAQPHGDSLEAIELPPLVVELHNLQMLFDRAETQTGLYIKL